MKRCLNKRSPCLVVALVLIAAISDASEVKAELPLSAYREMQKDAPEEVRIHVLRVQNATFRCPDGITFAVAVRAKVQSVTRTATNLKQGSIIDMTYLHQVHPPMPGASEIPILEAGKVYPAFLERAPKQKTYKPAAGSYSFDKLKDERKEA